MSPDRKLQVQRPWGGSGRRGWCREKGVWSGGSDLEGSHVDNRERRAKEWEEATHVAAPEARRECFKKGVMEGLSDLPTLPWQSLHLQCGCTW